MARRALDFATANPVNDTGFATVLKRLSDTVAQSDNLGILQGDGTVNEHSAIAQRKNLRDIIRRHYLRRLVQVGRVVAATSPTLVGKFVMPPHGMANKGFILAARQLLGAATAHQDALTAAGIGATFAADLGAALDQLDQATETAHLGRSNHVGASADLQAIAGLCVNDVKILGTFIGVAFANEPDILAAWRSASTVAGPFKRTPEPAPEPAPEPPPAPVEP